MQEKLAITVLVITLALFALIMVLYRIIRDNNEQYKKIVLTQRQQEYESRVIPYRRGDIVDRNGTYLATSEKVYNLIIDPRQIMSAPERYLEPTIETLVASFGFDAGELRAMIEEKKDSAYLRYSKGRQLTYDQRTAFEQLAKEKNDAYIKNKDEVEGRKRVKGVWFEDEYKRIYPYNSMACSVIGFTSSDGSVGTGGIEQYYNSSLIGVNGREYGYLDENSNLEGVVKSATNGKTVVSTIDVNIQNIVQKYINEWQTTVGSKVTAAIVMNPNNGEILAMGTSSVFDLNNPRDVSGYTQEDLMALGKKEAAHVYRRENDGETITEDQVLDHYSREEVLSYGQQVAWNQIWRNFCVSDTYEPGSPSKIFTVAAGLEEGVIKTTDSFECTGYLHVGDWDIKCTAYRRGGHGWLDVQESLMQSCNVAMMRMGAMIGRERFTKYQSIFGFGDKTGIDLPGEADTSGLVHTADDMGPTDLATNAFGQNYNCTMVQMAAAFCSVLNGGSYYEPHVVKQILNEQGSVVEKKESVLVRETVSRSTSDFLKEAMFQTVEVGTGKAAQVAGYDVGGKTGTAEKQPRSAKNYLVSFAGFAPIEDPQVFVYVVIDTPNYPPGEEQAHSSYASTVFSKIMTETLPYLNIFPTNDLDEDGSIQENLPSSEGINEVSTEESGEGQGELVEETEKQYETDEYVPDDGGAGSGVPDAVPKDPSGSEEPPMDTGRTQPVRTSAPSSQGQDDQGGQDAARDSTAAGTEKTQ
ncbi:penicillin-binding protein 2 [Enterocloster aldenensis]|nr:penicillin-binding protein 2 [Enterocloster aldenensis]